MVTKILVENDTSPLSKSHALLAVSGKQSFEGLVDAPFVSCIHRGAHVVWHEFAKGNGK
jgi:hypothetical protein